MNENETKIARYLKDAHVLEGTLRRTLIAHIAVSPDGEHRRLLREHLRVTVEQEGRLADRLSRLEGTRNPALAVVGVAKEGAAIALTLVKGPADALRGPTGGDVAMRNAQDECASEALEIAVYDTLEALAEELGDAETADLARRHRAQEQDFLDRLRAAMPGLARGAAQDSGSGLPLGLGGVLSAARALISGAQTALNPTAGSAPPAPAPAPAPPTSSPDPAGTAGTAGKKAAAAADKLKAEPVRKPASSAKPTPTPSAETKPKAAAKPKAKPSARKPVAKPTPAAKPAAKPEPVAELPAKAEEAPRADQPLAQYDDMTPYEIGGLLDHLPEEKLDEVEQYERANGQREQVLDAIEKLRATTGAG